MDSETFWLVLGFTAQALFGGRMFIQWIISEKKGESVVPPVFWLLSLAGGFLLFIYALKRMDPVFILGQASGLIIYSRNIYFIYRRKNKEPSEGAPQSAHDRDSD